MEEKSHSLFVDSYQMHQKLVDTILKFKEEDGVCRISQPQLALLVDRSQTWVSQAIRRINTEEVCIEAVGSGAYVVRYENLIDRGTFAEVFWLMLAAYDDPSIIHVPDKEIATARNIKVTTVQMFKAYVRTGWKKAFADELERGSIIQRKQPNEE